MQLDSTTTVILWVIGLLLLGLSWWRYGVAVTEVTTNAAFGTAYATAFIVIGFTVFWWIGLVARELPGGFVDAVGTAIDKKVVDWRKGAPAQPPAGQPPAAAKPNGTADAVVEWVDHDTLRLKATATLPAGWEVRWTVDDKSAFPLTQKVTDPAASVKVGFVPDPNGSAKAEVPFGFADVAASRP